MLYLNPEYPGYTHSMLYLNPEYPGYTHSMLYLNLELICTFIDWIVNLSHLSLMALVEPVGTIVEQLVWCIIRDSRWGAEVVPIGLVEPVGALLEPVGLVETEGVLVEPIGLV